MKLLVKRTEHKHFEKAKIEIEDVKEWTLLSRGLEALLKETNDTIEFWTDQVENPREWADLESAKRHLEKSLEEKERLEKLIQVLEVENEAEWNGN